MKSMQLDLDAAAAANGTRVCRMCLTELPLLSFSASLSKREGKARRRSECKPCNSKRNAAAVRAAYKKDPEKFKAASSVWRKKNRLKIRNRMLWYDHGISDSERDRMLASQGGACAICETVLPVGGRTGLHVDHDHVTGKVRGILCMNCNMGIGKFHDSSERLRKAAGYLERTK